jgi:hypothetical protein
VLKPEDDPLVAGRSGAQPVLGIVEAFRDLLAALRAVELRDEGPASFQPPGFVEYRPLAKRVGVFQQVTSETSLSQGGKNVGAATDVQGHHGAVRRDVALGDPLPGPVHGPDVRFQLRPAGQA